MYITQMHLTAFPIDGTKDTQFKMTHLLPNTSSVVLQEKSWSPSTVAIVYRRGASRRNTGLGVPGIGIKVGGGRMGHEATSPSSLGFSEKA
jgi:hypothetical protein